MDPTARDAEPRRIDAPAASGGAAPLHAEEALRESEERFRVAFQTSPDASRASRRW